MKRTGFFILLQFLLCWGLFAQKKNITPPGTVQINDTLYADIQEVDNISWREYLYYLQQFDQPAIEKALPDTLLWGTDTSSIIQIGPYYLRHPGFNSYPVVGISYAQAIEFCKWRTNQANFGLYLKKNKIKEWEKHLTDSFPILFSYRLPTNAEWESLAAGKQSPDQYPFGVQSISVEWDNKLMHAFNCQYPLDSNGLTAIKYNDWYTVPTRSFWINEYGLYNMIGNVAEMVQEEGIAKGGSFDHKLEDCKIKNKQTYSGPQRWLGFRCVAVVVK